MVKDLVEMKGRVDFHLLREDGTEETWSVDNLVVTNGKTIVAGRLASSAIPPPVAYMGVGTGGTAPTVADVGLVAEVTRIALSAQSVAGAVVTYTCSFAPGIGTGALQEAGIFNISSGVGLFARTTFAVINKAAGDALGITWTVTVG